MFTCVASCLQWPSVSASTWAATAFFYASIVFALVAIVTGSQQMLLLSGSRDVDDGLMLEMLSTPDRAGRARPRAAAVFALQAPLMLLTLSVMAFLAGLWAIVFSPLRAHLAWDDSAKVCEIAGIEGERLMMERRLPYCSALRMLPPSRPSTGLPSSSTRSFGRGQSRIPTPRGRAFLRNRAP